MMEWGPFKRFNQQEIAKKFGKGSVLLSQEYMGMSLSATGKNST